MKIFFKSFFFQHIYADLNKKNSKCILWTHMNQTFKVVIEMVQSIHIQI
jgi:hypothetical protein